MLHFQPELKELTKPPYKI